jgi:hypothetical protein
MVDKVMEVDGRGKSRAAAQRAQFLYTGRCEEARVAESLDCAKLVHGVHT